MPDFPIVNIDLIYGAARRRKRRGWHRWMKRLASARGALPLPALRPPADRTRHRDRRGTTSGWRCYRAGATCCWTRLRAGLDAMFQRGSATGGPTYCCQDDGMVGLGCGARSYTRGLHYSREYAVGAPTSRASSHDYLSRAEDDFAASTTASPRRRRAAPPLLIQSLLASRAASTRGALRAAFRRDVLDDLPQLLELAERGPGHGRQRTAAAHRRGAGALRRDRAVALLGGGASQRWRRTHGD